MKLRMFSVGAVMIAVSAIVPFSPAAAQKSGSMLYAMHSSPSGTCPGLDWHITVTGDNLEGFVSVDHAKRMWRLNGTVKPASAGHERSFDMNAEEVGGTHQKAVIKGTSGGEYVNASITGAGTACDGKMLSIPRVLNGVEGGGG